MITIDLKYPHSIEKLLYQMIKILMNPNTLDKKLLMCYNKLIKALLLYRIKVLNGFKMKLTEDDIKKIKSFISELMEYVKEIKKEKIEKDRKEKIVAFKARNEVGSFYAETIKSILERQDNILFKWHTQQDDRVRHSHQAREGNIYDKTTDLLPGQEFNCRCWGTFYIKGRDTKKFVIIE